MIFLVLSGPPLLATTGEKRQAVNQASEEIFKGSGLQILAGDSIRRRLNRQRKPK
tara:strand:- start:286 stop:450 length:165 start_codon:yes stop_codon:yes gene_type:complete